MYSSMCWSVCPAHEVTPDSQIKLAGESVMIVVHATSSYDSRFTSKLGVDGAIRFAKEKHIPVIYLQDDSPEQFYFMDDCNPDYWVHSQGGEIHFDMTPAHLYIVGGHLELCLSATLHDVIYQWAKKPPRDHTVTYFMDAIYSNGKSIDPSEPYYGDLIKFLNVVSYGRPGGEYWTKLNLLESMGLIVRQDNQIEYIKGTLPHWERTFPDAYQVEVQLRGSVNTVLRSAPGWNPPRILFDFVDSAIYSHTS